MSYKLSVQATLVAVGLTLAGSATSGGRGHTTPMTPVILSATTDLTENQMIIGGDHFGSTAPEVTLARRVLKVKSFSETQVVVDLPKDIGPATYSLTVTTNGPHRLTSRPFSAALFAVGN